MLQERYDEVAQAVGANREAIFTKWRQLVQRDARAVAEIFGDADLSKLLTDVLELLAGSLASGGDIRTPSYAPLLRQLEHLSTEATINGVSPTEAAMFTFALKQATYDSLHGSLPKDGLADGIILINDVIDRLGLFTFETYVATREVVIKEQQRAILDVSVPVVRIWDKILMLPLIGMIDSNRTQLMMETLLGAIEKTQSRVAILDISGISVVDSLVARHLILTASAARLMGADCIITGISSRISQTMVNLGVDLSGVVTRTALADGLRLALELTGQSLSD